MGEELLSVGRTQLARSQLVRLSVGSLSVARSQLAALSWRLSPDPNRENPNPTPKLNYSSRSKDYYQPKVAHKFKV